MTSWCYYYYSTGTTIDENNGWKGLSNKWVSVSSIGKVFIGLE